MLRRGDHILAAKGPGERIRIKLAQFYDLHQELRMDLTCARSFSFVGIKKF